MKLDGAQCFKNSLTLQSQPSHKDTQHMRVIPGRLLHILEEAPLVFFVQVLMFEVFGDSTLVGDLMENHRKTIGKWWFIAKYTIIQVYIIWLVVTGI